MFCRKCGCENSDEAKFCEACGTPLVHPNPPKKPDKWVWIILMAVVVLSVVIAVILIQKNNPERMRYDTHVANAEKYLEELNYDEAEAEYLKAISIAPKEKKAYEDLIKLYEEWGKPERAERIRVEETKNVSDDKENKKQTQESYLSEKNNEDFEAESEKGQSNDENKDIGKDEGTDKNEHSQTDTTGEKDAKEEYTWIVKPTIEADDIYYVKSYDFSDHTVNDLNRQLKCEYAVIEKDNKLGLIGLDGKLNGEMVYRDISCYTTGSLFLYRINEKFEPSMGKEWSQYQLTENDMIEPISVTDGITGITYYYFTADETLQCYANTESCLDVEGIIPVQMVSDLADREGDTEWWEKVGGKYAVYCDGKRRTDYIYDECGSYSNGLLAVKKNGKWGYVNSEGKEVIPIKYDASWQHYSSSFQESKQAAEEFCYAASGGYVPLCKDGEWELRDTMGEIIIPAGIFDKICPVYDGKCWVNQDGKWGVISIKNDKIPKSAVSFMGHSYMFYSESMTWKEAKDYCDMLGGNLVEINSEEEQEFLNTQCIGKKNLYWIGLIYDNQSWKWNTGDNPTYTNWASGEPNEDFQGTELYTQMYGTEYGEFQVGQWNDSRNDSGTMEFWKIENIGFICEWNTE